MFDGNTLRQSLDYDGTHRYQVVDQSNDPSPEKLPTHRMSLANIIEFNVENIHQSLASVNTFVNKRNDKVQPMMLYEIALSGESAYKSMTLRELLRYLTEVADNVDEEYLDRIAPSSDSTAEHRMALLSASPPPASLQESLSLPNSPSSSAAITAISSSYRPDMQFEKLRRTNRRRGSKMGMASFSGSSSSFIAGNNNNISSSFSAQTSTNNNIPAKRRSTSIVRIPTSSNLNAVLAAVPPNLMTPSSSSAAIIAQQQQQQQQQQQDNTYNNNNNPNNPSSSSSTAIYQDYSVIKSLRLRDLRRLDTTVSLLNETAVIVRRHVVIFAMDPIKAVIMADRLLLVLPEGADSLIAILDQYMKEWIDDQQKRVQRESIFSAKMDSEEREERGLRPRNHAVRKVRRMNIDHRDFLSTVAFELHAYEALLMTVKELESQQVQHLANRSDALLQYYRQATLIPMAIQSELRQIKNDLSVILNRLEGCNQALQYVLEDDEEMALMNLSILKKKPLLYHFPLAKEILSKHDDVEELVESYSTDLNAISSRILTLKAQIQSSEELVSVRLDTAQNQLLFANTALLLITCCASFGSYIGGVFGVNLDQTIYIQPYRGSFAIVSGGSLAMMVLLYILIFGYFRWAKILPANYSVSQSAIAQLLPTLFTSERFDSLGSLRGRERELSHGDEGNQQHED